MAGIFAAFVRCALLLIPLSGLATTVEVPPEAGGKGIQQALDKLGVGGQVVLQAGTYLVDQPIILRQDRERLCGAGLGTILFLADNANCPVIILGPPKDQTKGPTKGLGIRHLLVDGNRTHQQRELWRVLPNGVNINNNGVHVCDVVDATIEQIVCRHCRSGGVVSTGQTRRLTVRDYAAYDNQFDGLACYRTGDSHFSQLNLHDNLAAGISLDLGFDHNVISGAVLADNDLGIFMRDSHDNVREGVTIRHSRHDGVFMAQAGDETPSGWRLFPDTQCTGNEFQNLFAQALTNPCTTLEAAFVSPQARRLMPKRILAVVDQVRLKLFLRKACKTAWSSISSSLRHGGSVRTRDANRARMRAGRCSAGSVRRGKAARRVPWRCAARARCPARSSAPGNPTAEESRARPWVNSARIDWPAAGCPRGARAAAGHFSSTTLRR
jgi:hypothetical protein